MDAASALVVKENTYDMQNIIYASTLPSVFSGLFITVISFFYDIFIISLLYIYIYKNRDYIYFFYA